MSHSKTLLLTLPVLGLVLFQALLASSQAGGRAISTTVTDTRPTSRTAPTLGTDMDFASTPSPLIDGWLDKREGDEMAAAFRSAGLKSLRFSSHGFYSPVSPEATVRLKAENKLTNQYQWFPFDAYVDFIAAHEFTTIVGINVEEGYEVARSSVQKFIDRGLKSRIVAIELSNEPWLNYRPWQPEDYAARAAEIIEQLTSLGLRFALPLTAGNDNNTPTRLTDSEWCTRMLRSLSTRIDLKQRSDIYGVVHLYSKGMRGASIDAFNKVVKPFAPNLRYLVTEFNIRLGLEGNPHLTNKYAMEFARRLADVMSRPEIEAMYTHAVPSHSVLYWSNGRRYVTVVGGRDKKLTGDALKRGWHLTPTGRVYELYSRLAWNGEIIDHHGGDKQIYWAVKSRDGLVTVTFINDVTKNTRKKLKLAGVDVMIDAPPRSIVCVNPTGKELERLVLLY
jgi:hypothetical protein